MAARARNQETDTIIGVVLLVLGILVLFGPLGVGGALVTVAAVAAIVVGILVLVKVVRGTLLWGILLVLLGVLLLVPNPLSAALANVLEVLVAVLLIALGVLKLMRKW